jgi:hypothetical protein
LRVCVVCVFKNLRDSPDHHVKTNSLGNPKADE